MQLPIILSVILVATSSVSQESSSSETRPTTTWLRGNTHTHTLWSDGDAPPELAIKWYVDNGYDFLVLSDHNLVQMGEDWFPIAEGSRLTPAQVDRLRTEFGDDWPEVREREGESEMRLRTLPELKAQFEADGSFLLVPGEEITDRFQRHEVHINALNIENVIRPQRGGSVQQTIQRNLDAVIEHGRATGREVLAHLNHPNFAWSITVEDLAAMRGERFFEIYNGHRSTNHQGDATHPSTEEMWDRALVLRLHEGAGDGELLYGLATDDAHNHYEIDEVSVPGRGWVMVRCDSLESEAIIKAMKAGEFYASSGVRLKDVRRRGDVLEIEIDGDSGVNYLTEFIVTRLRDGEPVTVGEIAATSDSRSPRYRMTGDELYVRARITSTRPHPRPYLKGDFEMAWTQPVRPAASRDILPDTDSNPTDGDTHDRPSE